MHGRRLHETILFIFIIIFIPIVRLSFLLPNERCGLGMMMKMKMMRMTSLPQLA
jgi:hypothetical protein